MYWDTYGAYASGSFDSFEQNGQSVAYSFKIFKKSYKGVVHNTLCSADAMIHRYLNDDPIAPIKGSELELNLINKDGTMPLASFYADSDDTFKISVDATTVEPDPDNPPSMISITRRLFEGYLIQEDCEEILSDFAHEIRLVFTDNLGVLKDITFDDANKLAPITSANIRQDIMAVALLAPAYFPTSYGYRVYVSKSTGSPQVGDYVTIQRAGAANGTYTILKIEAAPATTGYWLHVAETFDQVALGSTSALVTYITSSNLLGKIKLSDAIRICLYATNLPLEVYYLGNLQVVKEGTVYSRFLENTYIDPFTFVNYGITYDSCYGVLEKILGKFGITLYQADGKWFLMRSQELRYYGGQMAVYKYTSYMVYYGTQYPWTKLSTYGVGNCEEGVSETLLRPWQSYTEQMEYTLQDNNLYNGSLQNLGPLIARREFTIGSTDYYAYDYETLGFNKIGTDHTDTITIIRTKIGGNEVDRFLRIKKTSGSGTNRYAAYTRGVEVNQGDKLKISLQVFGWNRFTLDDLFILIYVEKSSSTSDKYFLLNLKKDDNHLWQSETNIDFTISPINVDKNPIYISAPTLANISTYPEYISIRNQNNNIEINSEAIPVDGILRIYFGYDSSGEPALTDYRNIKVEIIPQTSGTIGWKGHSWKSTGGVGTKNVKQEQTYLDDTVKNFIKGTLFLNAFTGFIQKRTLFWRDGMTLTDYDLSRITTRQQKLWRDKIRSKLEGSLFPLMNSSYERLTMFNPIIFSPKNGKYYIFGKAEFNLKRNMVRCTMYEMWRDGDNMGGIYDEDIRTDFKFIYK